MKGIIMSGPMVRAILDGRKQQTRRVVKLPEDVHADPDLRVTSDGMDLFHPKVPQDGTLGIKPPFQPGETVYVKETWAQNNNQRSDVYSDRSLVYRADGETRATDEGVELPWRSPLHMPEWASRIKLRINSVRVERLQDISEADIRAEGFGVEYDDYTEEAGILALPSGTKILSLQEFFAVRWDNIAGQKPGRSWADNPWVWVIEFEALEAAA